MKSFQTALILLILTLTACSSKIPDPTDEDFANANAEVFCLAQKNFKNLNEQAIKIYEKHGIYVSKSSADNFTKRMQNYDEKLMKLIETKIRKLNCSDEETIKEYFTPLNKIPKPTPSS